MERVADLFDDLAHLPTDDAEFEDVAAARAFHDLPIDVAGDQPPVVEHRLRALQCA